MDQLPQQLINSAWQGAALAVFALGYALVFGSLGIVNLAHGAIYMWGALLAFLCVATFGWPLWIGGVAVMGWLLVRGATPQEPEPETVRASEQD